MYISRYLLGIPGSLFVSLFLFAPVTSYAQRGSPSVGGNSTASSRRDAIFRREADIENRELNLRLLREPGKVKGIELSPEEHKYFVDQIFEDFERIQIVNRELTQISANLNGAAYKQMSNLAGEMNKRAKRLKNNLGIPGFAPSEKDSEKVHNLDDAQLKTSLQTLNASVKGFVTNPIFKDPRVTDVRHLESLRRDISTVIELSDEVKKAASKKRRH